MPLNRSLPKPRADCLATIVAALILVLALRPVAAQPPINVGWTPSSVIPLAIRTDEGVHPTIANISFDVPLADGVPGDTNSPGELPLDDLAPRVLRPPQELPPFGQPEAETPAWPPSIVPESFVPHEPTAPLGFSGRSSIALTEYQEDAHFQPVEDRWRIGFPSWDRYGQGHPPLADYPYLEGNWLNPYRQNVLKGDYPIIGQHTFFNFTATNSTLIDFRQVPTPTTPFESTGDPNQEEFFGNPNQFFVLNNLFLSFDLFHGDTSFKPQDWRIKATPVFNANYLDVEELAVVSPDVRKGNTRSRTFTALQEWFVETKLADLGPDYDFVSIRGGSQPFVSDFRGFIFADVNRGVRLFGTRNANRDQFNLVAFDQTEKDTNSGLNTFHDRHQNTVIANYYRQDFVWPGYTTQVSYHFNHDGPSFLFDRNGFLARPDPAGVFAPHEVNSHYLGWTGNGHINRINISHAFYWAFGKDSLNPIAGQPISINAQMAALELSYDRDWVRFRTSAFWSSGDHDATDNVGTGFDTILENPNFAGGQFSYWQRNGIRLFGVGLVDRFSLTPDLRSSKLQGQQNFVNPGLLLFNVGMDFDITPKFRAISNVNFLWFDHTDVLERFVFQGDINTFIGGDLSLGFEYRPLHNNNVIVESGVSGLIPGRGFKDLYNPLVGEVGGLFAAFTNVVVQY